jgi:hypothetical protein
MDRKSHCTTNFYHKNKLIELQIDMKNLFFDNVSKQRNDSNVYRRGVFRS